VSIQESNIQVQVVLVNDLGCEIYRSDIKKIDEMTDLTEVLIRALRADCIELNNGDSIKIEEIKS